MYYGCNYCKDKGKTINRTHIYPPNDLHEELTAKEMREWALKAEEIGDSVFGVKGVSCLSGIINIPFSVPIDYMHAVLEGVTKTLLKCWFSTQNHCNPYYL